jgi:hypothetical protein
LLSFLPSFSPPLYSRFACSSSILTPSLFVVLRFLLVKKLVNNVLVAV